MTHIGKVKWFNDKRGYGFITPEDGGKDVYVHFTGIMSREKHRRLADGENVSFQIEKGERGDKAVKVKVLSEAVA